MTLLSIALILFLIMDPLGNITPYLKMVKNIDPKKQKKIVLREMLIALAFMVGFNYLGEVLFEALELSESTVRLSAGLILFLIAVTILFPSLRGLRAQVREEEPFIIPLAVPLIAGPSLLATIMLFAHLEESLTVMLFAILIAWIFAVIILLFAQPIKRVMGTNGLLAFEKLMGMILVFISIQQFMEGLQLFIKSLP